MLNVEAVKAAQSVAGIVLGQLNDAVPNPGGRAGHQVEGRI